MDSPVISDFTATRRARLPVPSFPEDLPIAAKRSEIARAIEQHQVVIVCGETGSGKTTQLPKICLSFKRGVAGLIGHTQPRRIAARTVAARIATELNVALGGPVGYKVRFSDRTSRDAYVKVMTDGILLAETQSDRDLLAYDTIIIDEAHERSLNIDFLLGFLKQLLPRRPDLKLIITSATLDAERFSRHFDNAPVIEVSGRMYPVEVRYRPPPDDQNMELPQLIANALDEVFAASSSGDALVFLPGEREIREAAQALAAHHPKGTEILPLYARLSHEEQQRVFQPGGMRRIVLATNVAETSLTVPNIRFVIDPGLARVNRYSHRNKVEMLHVEKISRASADQRKGRCGRVAAGICVRLYSEDDYLSRPAYTDPEILRSSLAAVILRMKALRLPEIEGFPFVEAPSSRMVAEGYRQLHELGAIDSAKELTRTGQELAKLPIDPRLGRMIVAAREQNSLAEVLIIASALAVDDPRQRPTDKREAADAAHRAFADERSEFLGYLNLWKFFDDALKHRKSRRKLSELCRTQFLSLPRMLEWRDLHSQLHAVIGEMGWRLNQVPARYEEIHKALLSGLLGNIGIKSEGPGVFLGARGLKFSIFPGSALKKKTPRWLVAAELIETNNLYAHCVAEIDPEWVERMAPHLTRRTYHDPHWEKKSAQVVAEERVTLYGLVVARHRRNYGTIDPKEAREIFIRALAAGEYRSRGEFQRANERLIREIEELEHKARRQDVLVDEERIFAFFASRIPQDVWDGARFERWRKQAERATTRLLYLDRDDLMRHEAVGITEALFPESLELSGAAYPLTYCFNPGHPLDGVTLTVPLHAFNRIPAGQLEWLVPGLLREKVTTLLRGLPGTFRRSLVPLPRFVTAVLETLTRSDRPLCEALTTYVRSKTGLDVARELHKVEVPPHLKMNIKVVDEAGQELAMGRDLAELQAKLGAQARERFAQAQTSGIERHGITRWDFGDLPEKVQVATRAGYTITAYPALVDQKTSVSLVPLDKPEAARKATRVGLIRLLRLALSEQVKYMERSLPNFQAMAMAYSRLPASARESVSAQALKDELVAAVLDQVFLANKPDIRTAAEFTRRLEEGRPQLATALQEIAALAADILDACRRILSALAAPHPATWEKTFADIREQLEWLTPPDFLSRTPLPRLKHFPRYLQAIELRLDKLAGGLERDLRHLSEIAPHWNRLRREWKGDEAAYEEYRWMLEELRVSLFAQELRTPYPVSVKRLEKRWQNA
jgi:ATP-dependent helicase HrpA